jgi:serpin B
MRRRLPLLGLPKFGFACAVPMRDSLAALGMGVAFDPSRADFSAMATRPEVMLRVVHRTRIQVDERGLLAAAGSGVEMAPTSVGEPPVPRTLDRPFAFALVDSRTGAVAFAGQVTDPT